MILVSGSSVVSVRNGLPSTVPFRTTDARRLIGNRRFVTLVGFEKAGATRSTRRSSAATGSSCRPAAAIWALDGCDTGVATLGLHARAGEAAGGCAATATPKPANAVAAIAVPVPITVRGSRRQSIGVLRRGRWDELLPP